MEYTAEKEKSMKRLFFRNYYENIDLNVEVARSTATEEEILKNLEGLEIILKEDHISLKLKGQETIIKNEQRELYFFEKLNKILPDPVEVSDFSEQQILDLLNNDSFMITGDDFDRLEHNISQVYQILKTSDPIKSEFVFSSSSYKFEK